MAITDWPVAERPREKLLTHGANALSDAELLAIFLRTGCAGRSAVDMARDLLSSFGGLRAILAAEETAFCSAHGLGKAKYAQLQAVLEMSRRHLQETLCHTPIFNCPDTVKDYLRSKLRHKTQEVFVVLLLNSQHQLLKYKEMFYGTINAASVYPREVVKYALSENAAAVVLAHNHPSGVAEPSQADRHITRELSRALSVLDIQVLDHFVVGDSQTISFAERGWM